MGNFYALRGAYLQQLRVLVTPGTLATPLIIAVPLVATLAWIGSQIPNTGPLAYISVGVFLMLMWNWIVFVTGFSLATEFDLQTLEHIVVCRTPLIVVIFGKVLAIVTTGFPGGIAAFLVVPLVSRQIVDVSSPLLMIVSLGFAIFGVLSVSLIFAPLFLLVRGRPGFFNAIMPFGVVLSGFLYPISLFSPGVEILARFLPTSWAMEGIIRSIETGGATWRVASDWGVALALSLVYLGLSYLLLRKVEKQIRVTGSLSSF